MKNIQWYQKSWRRMLIDMHIPDWEKEFLSKYEPEQIAEQYERAGLQSVMFYCQSHTGICNWPAKTGKVHEALLNRDVVEEMVDQLKKRDIFSCAYYSVIFNNWAYLAHEEWRIVSANPGSSIFQGRAGNCCPNNPDYRSFALEQARDLVERYDFDGFFYDMTFWPNVCLCPHCRELYKKETEFEIPEVIDWTDENWCTFQNSREKWMSDFAGELTTTVKNVRPNISVYHNFATSFFNWVAGIPTYSAVHHDFLGGDFYGSPHEQLLVIKLMTNLTENAPAEFMTSRCIDLHDHVNLKRVDKMEMQAHAATLFSAAFLFIDAIDPVGTVNPAVYERISDIFEKTSKYEPWLGGEGVEDIAVYFSNSSKMDFAENGKFLSECGLISTYPHREAAVGAVRILQEAHVPFGVITQKQLDSLSNYKVIILPNVLRMCKEEITAFRKYVENGGKLYASGWTSLTEVSGERHEDFMLADVFGCHFDKDDLGRFAYLKPVDGNEIFELIKPQDSICVLTGRTLRLKTEAEGEVLATLTLPYASPHPGTVNDQNWASFHSSPPWEDTKNVFLVKNNYGKGKSVYCATDMESVNVEASDKLFIHLIKNLLEEEPSYSAETFPGVWMNVNHQSNQNRYIIGFLNYQSQLPAIPISKIPFTLRPDKGKIIKRLISLPDEKPVEFILEEDGTMKAEAEDLQVFKMLLAEY